MNDLTFQISPFPIRISSEMENKSLSLLTMDELGLSPPSIDEAEIEASIASSVGGAPIFLCGDGSYYVIAPKNFSEPPHLAISFRTPGLSAQQVSFDTGINQPTSKARFWISDKGGRIKDRDMRLEILNCILVGRW